MQGSCYLDPSIARQQLQIPTHTVCQVCREGLAVARSIAPVLQAIKAAVITYVPPRLDDLDLENVVVQCGAMREARGSLGAASLNGKLYAAGGGQPGRNLATAEMLDPEINQWMGIKVMSQARFSTTASTVDNAVYVVGGFNGEAYLHSVEMLDPRTGRWQLVRGPALQHISFYVSRDLHHRLYAWNAEK